MANVRSLKSLKPVTPTLFTFAYSAKYLPPGSLTDYASDVAVRRMRDMALYQSRAQTGLWYSSRALAKIAPKRLPRSRARRRLLLAFKAALSDHGLSEDGLVHPGGEAPPRHGFAPAQLEDVLPPIDLSGTLRLSPHFDVVNARYGDLREESGMVIRYLMRLHWLWHWSPSLRPRG
ncbi:MAG: hypothetical protein INR71_04295 [Terriglobus roseus]|nr:hypothetical protein [Terriglobus roseus]